MFAPLATVADVEVNAETHGGKYGECEYADEYYLHVWVHCSLSHATIISPIA